MVKWCKEKEERLIEIRKQMFAQMITPLGYAALQGKTFGSKRQNWLLTNLLFQCIVLFAGLSSS